MNDEVRDPLDYVSKSLLSLSDCQQNDNNNPSSGNCNISGIRAKAQLRYILFSGPIPFYSFMSLPPIII